MEREVRISCPDATGLGCDVTRMLLDFGLRIVHGDMSTDGKWCFLIFRVSSLSSQPVEQQSLFALLMVAYLRSSLNLLAKQSIAIHSDMLHKGCTECPPAQYGSHRVTRESSAC